MTFVQEPPVLGNQWDGDRVLRSYLARWLPKDVHAAIEPELRSMGELVGGELRRLQVEDQLHEPRLVSWDAWGNRIDRIDVTPLWVEAAKLAAERGVVAAAYDDRFGEHARVHQFALAYLFEPSVDVYTCPLAMTDGAARTLLAHDAKPLIERALPRLLSRDPATMWTSGQWMTERTGGSDVAISETVATKTDEGYRLFGTKWFTSATTAQMALTLARPEGAPPGGSGLALFYLELRDAAGRPNGVVLNRLKDKLGTRKVPTAELELVGALATPVAGLRDGVKNITPMLNVTRTWNTVAALGGMRRGLALARDYAKKRVAFGAPLARKPLHVDTLAWLAAEWEAAFQLGFYLVRLIGREEKRRASADDLALLRLLTPIAKLTTGRQGVMVASEIVESFGGAGYVEDTGIPKLLRDAQVLSIWEGTTNVLALDLLRGLARGGGLGPLDQVVRVHAERARAGGLAREADLACRAMDHVARHLATKLEGGRELVEAGARRVALTIGRALELALLAEHAVWSRDVEKDGRALAAARRFACTPIDLLDDEIDERDASALANDEPIPVG